MKSPMFSLEDKVIAITGGAGALASAVSVGLADLGATILPLVRKSGSAESLLGRLSGAGHRAYYCDVLDEASVQRAVEEIMKKHGRIDVWMNAAGGNRPGATVGPQGDFHQIDAADLDAVLRLNVQGTMVPSAVVSKAMIAQGHGHIINFSSMAASSPLTRVVGYSAAKAAIDNFTRWLAVELASKHGEKFRVNAIAPGFFLGEQNRRLLLDENENLTARGQTIIDHTPMGRFGQAEELTGTLAWLCSDASRFVTGTIVAVDGGFSAFSGV